MTIEISQDEARDIIRVLNMWQNDFHFRDGHVDYETSRRLMLHIQRKLLKERGYSDIQIQKMVREI